jgi:hypothetical protein
VTGGGGCKLPRPELGRMRKGEAEFGAGAGAIQSIFSDCQQPSDRVTEEVGKLGGLEIAKRLARLD